MDPSELLHFLVGVLERLQLSYFVTGSTVTIFYGEPRFTNDIDVVIALPESIATIFCQQFPEEDFYVARRQFATPSATDRSSTSFIQAPVSRSTT